MMCRHCRAELTLPFVDLGSAPPSNAFLTREKLTEPEKWYPLRVMVCTECWLAQTEDYAGREELFDENYAYFSSYSTTWLRHAEDYVSAMVSRFDLGKGSRVAEVAANDGYLLQYLKARGIPCYGIEPTASTAAAAREKGIAVIEDFFSVRLAGQLLADGKQADLIIANNVLAHVPDINDFVKGFTLLLALDGIATFEFPHLMQLVAKTQFDTVYHEHYSYLSLTAVEKIFSSNGLTIFDVEELPTHGGSLRVYAHRSDTGRHAPTVRLAQLLKKEASAGVTGADFYRGFQAEADRVKNDLLHFLLDAWRSKRRVAAYGAAAKGNTLLNYAGVRPDLLAYVVDKNPAKQGKFLPGSRIPVVSEDRLTLDRPEIIFILPWNIREEITAQLEYVHEWGGTFITAVPKLSTTGICK